MMSMNTAQLGASSQGTAGPADFTDLMCLGTGATLLAFLQTDGESQQLAGDRGAGDSSYPQDGQARGPWDWAKFTLSSQGPRLWRGGGGGGLSGWSPTLAGHGHSGSFRSKGKGRGETWLTLTAEKQLIANVLAPNTCYFLGLNFFLEMLL